MANPTISLIIPTVSRPSLVRTLASVRMQRWLTGDEVILVGDGSQPIAREVWEQFNIPGWFVEVPGPSKNWGHTPRNLIMPQATGSHLMAVDDDDELTPDAVDIVRQALRAAPDRPHIFRMSGHHAVGTVWKEPVLREGNVGTPMMVAPNIPGKVAKFNEHRYAGDFDFIRDTCGHYPDGPVWHEGVICLVRPFARATSGA